MYRSPTALTVTLLFSGLCTAQPVDGFKNGDFEAGEAGQAPSGWFAPTPGTRFTLSSAKPAQGKLCAVLSRDAAAGGGGGAGFGNAMQGVPAAALQGKAARLSAQVCVEGDCRAQLWFRVDRPNQQPGFFDNMSDRPITGADWKTYEITGDIAPDATNIALGLMLFGDGKAYIADVQLTQVPPIPKADAPPRRLEGRALANLTAFARLVGCIRHFHPTDRALALDWNNFTAAGVERVEAANSPVDLAAALNALFAPIAPDVRVTLDRPPAEYPAPKDATRWHSWRHHGYAQQAPANEKFQIYSAKVQNEALDLPDGDRKGTRPGTVITIDLGDGLFARLPVGVYADDSGTLPKPTGEPAKADRPTGWRPTGDDRSTRLAAVILGWNVFEHFYPYFDVVQTDWPAALRDGLTSAATDPSAQAFQDTLGRLGAALHDGHTWVGGPLSRFWNLPLLLAWVGDDLVVERISNAEAVPGIRRGDVIVEIDGEPTADVAKRVGEPIAASTPQWKRYRLASAILASDKPGDVMLTLRRPDGSSASTRVARVQGANVKPYRPDNGAEVAPGILYFNLDGTEVAELDRLMPRLAQAKGVVFDLRGYPNSAGAALLPHLTDKNIHSAHWNIPTFLMPDRQGTTFDTSNWDLPPVDPRITGKVVFITDGRAISYAESCMGIVEAYKLGDIVGGPTAGTNGNVISFTLPGGYSMSFTGMQVVKHDGTPHHGRGIFPTVPAEPTVQGIADGKDEVLEKAAQVAGTTR